MSTLDHPTTGRGEAPAPSAPQPATPANATPAAAAVTGAQAGTAQATATASPAAALPWALVAEDLRSLAWLHAAERSGEVWTALRRAGFPRALAVLPAEHEAVQALYDALAALDETRQQSEPTGRAYIDDRLAADYAAIYLTHGLSASPCGSVWLDEDHLALQGPTFAVREAYRRHGLQVEDWRSMPDDHLTHELSFVAHLLAAGERAEAASFLDQHLLPWLPKFAQRVAQRADTLVYAGLARLTDAACQRLRAALPYPRVVPIAAARTQASSHCGD